MSNVLIPLIAAAGHGLLFTLLWYRQDQRTRMGVWLGSYLAIWGIVCVIAVFEAAIDTAQWLRQVATYGWIISIGFLAFLTLEYGSWRRARTVVISAVLWLLLLGGVDFIMAGSPPLVWGLDELLRFPRANLHGALVIVTWIVAAGGLLVLNLYGSARARLPLHANRLIYWTIVLSTVFVGHLFFIVKDAVLSLIGVGLQLVGAGGLVYGVLSYRLFDVRGLARSAAGHSLSTLVTTLLIFIAILVAVNLPDEAAWPILVGLALVLAVLYQIGRPWTERQITQVVATQGPDPAAIVETYASRIGHVLEIDGLADLAIGTINELLGIRHGVLILVSV
jgi:hypothetical protein